MFQSDGAELVVQPLYDLLYVVADQRLAAGEAHFVYALLNEQPQQEEQLIRAQQLRSLGCRKELTHEHMDIHMIFFFLILCNITSMHYNTLNLSVS